MDYFEKYHIFRDPVHGFIKVYDVERQLIDSKWFKRLRSIKQLGTTFLIYPSANHTRFEHSIGTMHIASKMFDMIVEKDKNIDGDKILHYDNHEIDRMRILVRLTALLHDIGHSPFSHSAESLFNKDMPHEKYTSNIIKEDEEISNIIEQKLRKEYNIKITKENLASFFEKTSSTNPLIQQIISGPLDADKMDYLLRDSLHTGVAYGVFDIERLLFTLRVVKEYKEDREIGSQFDVALGIDEDGINAAEGLLTSRYMMFLQVYFHDIRRIYDKHLSDFIKELLKEDGYCGFYPIDINKFYKYDDDYVMNNIKRFALNDDKSPISDYAKILFFRKHYKPIKTKMLIDKKSDFPKHRMFSENVRLIKEDFQDIYFDSAKDYPDKFDPEKVNFYIKTEEYNNNDIYNYQPISDRIKLLKAFDYLDILRIYAPKGIKNQVETKMKTLKWE
jgi:uncharacterized protein